MKLYTAPNEVYQRPLASTKGRPVAVFLAGGISGCPTWQEHAIERLRQTDFVVLNPRRPEYGDSSEEGEKQIRWERFHMEQADLILFWFPEETACPITLFELGTWLYTQKALWIGCHPNYSKQFDVRMQYRLARPVREGDIADDLDKLLDELGRWDEDRRYLRQLKDDDTLPTTEE